MTQRLKTAGLAFLILVVGIGIIVDVTEYEVGADAAGPALLTVSDVVAALDVEDLDIAPERQPAHHPLLRIAGTTIRAGTSLIEVYVYQDVTTRVADEQVIQRYILNLQSLATDADQILRVTSARNILLLFHAETSVHVASIHAAARTLVSVAAR